MANDTSDVLLKDLYALLRRMEACPAHEFPTSETGVSKHHHPDPSRIGTPDTVQKKCTPGEMETREMEYARLMRRVKTFLANAPS